MSLTQELADRLTAQGVNKLGVVLQSSGAQYPADATSCVITNTGGAGSSKTQNDTGTQHSTAMLTFRAMNYALAFAMATAAYNALGGPYGLFNIVLSGTPYVSLNARQEPTDLGADGNTGLAMVVFNIEAEKQPS